MTNASALTVTQHTPEDWRDKNSWRVLNSRKKPSDNPEALAELEQKITTLKNEVKQSEQR